MSVEVPPCGCSHPRLGGCDLGRGLLGGHSCARPRYSRAYMRGPWNRTSEVKLTRDEIPMPCVSQGGSRLGVCEVVLSRCIRRGRRRERRMCLCSQAAAMIWPPRDDAMACAFSPLVSQGAYGAHDARLGGCGGVRCAGWYQRGGCRGRGRCSRAYVRDPLEPHKTRLRCM